MNFFEAQDRARRASRWLVVVYVVATTLIVLGVTAIVGFALYSSSRYLESGTDLFHAHGSILVATAILTTLFIFGASLYKTSVLSAGGGRVASAMGGTLVAADVSDPLRRRLRNVVEEMAIASGIPVPEIYVLEEESGINAFAAGFTPGDAAVAVTRGTLELLDREELQGVIAHEFSHVMNGDMRLNIRMMGVLFGIMVLGLIGRMIIRGGYHTSMVSSRRDRGTPVVLIVGIGLAVLGGIGVLFARVIKAAVSRQREYLADASAVQFTRQSSGIANALKKIGGYSEASYLQATDPEEVSHMLFGSGSRLFGLFATHPPLAERIRALDPDFSEQDYPRIDPLRHRMHADAAERSQISSDVTAAFASGGTVVLPESIADLVGHPEVEHVAYARELRQSIPPNLYDAAHSKELAFLLTIALILDRSGRNVERQLSVIEERLGGERTRLVHGYYRALLDTGAEYRLPLLEVSFPALKLRPTPQLGYLIELARRLIEIDGTVDLYEYCFYRILMSNVGQAIDPSGRRAATRASRSAMKTAATDLLAIIAHHGRGDSAAKVSAYQAGLEEFGAAADAHPFQAYSEQTVAVLDRSLDILLALDGKGRQRLLQAASSVAAHDNILDTAEAELIRVICATLDCPLPPILVRTTG